MQLLYILWNAFPTTRCNQRLFNKKDKLNTIYSFEKPNAEGKLEFVIEKNTDQKEYDSILYYVAMLSDDGKYYKKIIIIDID